MAGSAVPQFPDVSLDGDNYRLHVIPILKKIRPHWDLEQIQFKDYSTGKLNILMGVRLPSDAKDLIIIRMFPNNMDNFVDKKAELEHMKMLNEAAIGPTILAFFKNGFCYEFIPGESLTWQQVRQEHIGRLVAKAFAQLHTKVKVKEGYKDSLFDNLKELCDRFPEELPNPELNKRFKELISSRDVIEKERTYLESICKDVDSPIVFCHFDSVPENIIWNKADNSITFIDFEFAKFYHQAVDLAFHFCEFAGLDDFDISRYPDKDLQLKWLRAYLEAYSEFRGEPPEKVTDEQVGKLYVLVNKFAVVVQFFVAVICLTMGITVNPEFHLPYGLKRWEAYISTKDKLLNAQY